MRFDVITLFPDMFPGYLQQSLLGKAIQQGLVDIHLHDLRKWATDKHNRVDDRPYGGGPGMVLMVEPVVRCVESLRSVGDDPGLLVMLTPQGELLRQPVVERLAENRRIILLCGRYEGFDQRATDILKPLELSIGDYVLNGGEVAAMVTIDSVIRLVPGVLGDENSSIDDSFSTGNRLLEYPQYTRPREFRGESVPEVLVSGDHAAIEQWRREQSIQRTQDRRSDLFGE